MDENLQTAKSSNIQQADVNYCVTAIIDLLGFSSHLEVGANDLRTNIGQSALQRLQTLVDALTLMEKEKGDYPVAYPREFHWMRINDAVMLTMDLPAFLKPQIGSQVRSGWSVRDLEEHFDFADFQNGEEFTAAYNQKLSESLADLIRFIGLISRLHDFINKRENIAFFPGAKTIIASGYRRPFAPSGKEDVWAANFSFSNAYLADAQLHGSNFFLDCNLAQLLCGQSFARNLLRYASYIHKQAPFDPLVETEHAFTSPIEKVKSLVKEVSIFRKQFFFREFNTRPLTYLQTIEPLMKQLNGEFPPPSSDFSLAMFNAIKNGPSKEAPTIGALSGYLDIEESIEQVAVLIATGELKTVEQYSSPESPYLSISTRESREPSV